MNSRIATCLAALGLTAAGCAGTAPPTERLTTAQASVTGPWTNVDALAFYSNFGRSAIDVAAPGGNNATAVWAACSPFRRSCSR